MPTGMVYRFGPFEFDAETRRLSRDETRVPLSTPQAGMLLCLLQHAGQIVSRDTLVDVGWGNVAVTPNSHEVALHRLRKELGDGAEYIETVRGEGCRFVVPVERGQRDRSARPLGAQLGPFVAFVQGLAQLDTLDRHEIRRAREALEAGLRQAPDYARAHTLVAMACGLLFEASATDARRDTATLEAGVRHAGRACELEPASGEAWSALAFVLEMQGDTRQATAAALKAITLEPDNPRHLLRLAKVAWGAERMQAARQALALNSNLALAYWLRATVQIARGAYDSALDELRRGCDEQDAQGSGHVFPAIGLHLLHGLVLAARGDLDGGVAAFMRELAHGDGGHVYADICAANTWYALGAVRSRQGQHDESKAAFLRALSIWPSHVPATAALRGEVPATARGFEAVVGRAIVLGRCQNRHDEAARLWRDALTQAPPGHAGWILPIEPSLDALARGEIWKDALAIVRSRAT